MTDTLDIDYASIICRVFMSPSEEKVESSTNRIATGRVKERRKCRSQIFVVVVVVEKSILRRERELKGERARN